VSDIFKIFYRYGDNVSQTLKKIVESKGYDKIIASTSAFGKDITPRLGGLLDVQPITDVVQILVRDYIRILSKIEQWIIIC